MCDLLEYWESIPADKSKAVSYEQLEELWNMPKRSVRKTLELLSGLDNGDNYILIRSSRNKGFYKSDDPDEIAAYKKECKGRAVKMFAPLRKINRVLADVMPNEINYSFTNNLKLIRKERGLSQARVCFQLQRVDNNFDVSMLSRLENGWALPTPAQLRALASLYGCEPFELVAMNSDGANIFVPQSGLQVAQTESLRVSCDETRQTSGER